MKRILYIMGLMIAFMCVGTLSANADTTITKVDTDSGKYYAEFDRTLDWMVIKQSTGALVWISDTTEYSFEKIKELAMSVNPSLVHSVDYWGMIKDYGDFSNNSSEFPLPEGFQGNMWGTYWFMEAIHTHRFYVDIDGVSNVTYSYTDAPIIVTPPDKPKPPVTPDPPSKPDKPVVPVTPVTPDKPVLDHSPKTGDVDYQFVWLMVLSVMAMIVLLRESWHR